MKFFYKTYLIGDFVDDDCGFIYLFGVEDIFSVMLFFNEFVSGVRDRFVYFFYNEINFRILLE